MAETEPPRPDGGVNAPPAERLPTWWPDVAGPVAGVLLGWVSARPLASLAAGNLILWAAAVVALGAVPGSPRRKAARLLLLGFAVGFSFMCFGYQGAEPLSTRLLPFAAIGLFSGACAVVLGGLVHVGRGLAVRAASR